MPPKVPSLPPAFVDTPLLDLDFDETDELITDEPPLYSPRKNGKLIRLDIDPEDEN